MTLSSSGWIKKAVPRIGKIKPFSGLRNEDVSCPMKGYGF
jgi:hypothetical protein